MMKGEVWIMSLLLLTGTLACQKGAEGVPKEEQTKFPPPKWKADDTGRYPASMTAVVTLPTALQASMSDDDLLAAFINGECRGEGVKVKVEQTSVFFVLIRGSADEQDPIVFKYYSARTSYMYQTQPVLNFLVDDVYGTVQNPKVLSLNPVK